MRVLIVGATGLLGKEVVRLLSPEHQVIGASRTGATRNRGCRDLRRRCGEIRTA